MAGPASNRRIPDPRRLLDNLTPEVAADCYASWASARSERPAPGDLLKPAEGLRGESASPAECRRREPAVSFSRAFKEARGQGRVRGGGGPLREPREVPPPSRPAGYCNRGEVCPPRGEKCAGPDRGRRAAGALARHGVRQPAVRPGAGRVGRQGPPRGRAGRRSVVALLPADRTRRTGTSTSPVRRRSISCGAVCGSATASRTPRSRRRWRSGGRGRRPWPPSTRRYPRRGGRDDGAPSGGIFPAYLGSGSAASAYSSHRLCVRAMSRRPGRPRGSGERLKTTSRQPRLAG